MEFTFEKISFDAVAVFATIILRTFSYVPLISAVKRTHFTKNIPYEMLLMDFIASTIFITLALARGYYAHLVVFLIYFTLVTYMMMVKYDLERTPVTKSATDPSH